ncbi:beta-N-acetylhexosaminidase [Saccharicrinis sp. GN24d3]|uniref:beta-N-acetylhexosaminidase n=1 Tax=Saccharicrinis sp. GN24d3 TaxID=3458416 RepID=UPI004035648F
MTKIFYVLITCLLVLSSCDNELKEHVNSEKDYMIIPKPELVKVLNGRFKINHKTQVYGGEVLAAEGNYLAKMLSEASGESISFANQGNIQLKLDASMSGEEEYVLSVQYNKIEILAKTAKGIFYGIQTLRQLLPSQIEAKTSVQELTIPATLIKDAPRFSYRGMHLDVCRHFYSVEFIKRYLDVLALHKMNTFHWHLTEDQGWRIEIKKYPKLTEIGAWRNGTIVGNYPGTENDNKKYGGFYTQEEIKEVIAYAAQKHITVIPEIELPGHSSAAIAAYTNLSCFPKEQSIVPNSLISEGSKKAQKNGNPKVVQESWGVYDDVYCAGKEETFAFLEDVLAEVMDLFPSKYVHIGGDECPKGNWERCPHCQKRMAAHDLKDEHELQSYFITRIEKFVNSKGKQIIGWDEILEGGLAPNATVMSWRGNAGGIAAAKSGHDVIMSPNSTCYFDYYQSEDKEKEPIAIGGFLPVEKVYAFDPVPDELNTEEQKYILGGQANLWTEYIGTEEYAEYMLLPRLTALSEAVWTKKELKEWEDFTSRLNHFKNRYDAMGLNYATHVFDDHK